MLHWILKLLTNTFIMNLKLGEDTDGALRTMGIGESLYTGISWLYSNCVTYYGHMGNSQIQLAALGSI
jgi:hypothetical protein